MTSFDNDELDNEEQADLIGELTQNVEDYLDIWNEISERNKLLAQVELNKDIHKLTSIGFVIYGTQRVQLVRNVNGDSIGRHSIFTVLESIMITFASKMKKMIAKKDYSRIIYLQR